MQRVVIHGPGSYDQLRLETSTTPQAGPGEVLVEVEAIGVNYADCVVRMGLYESAKKYVGWPITPGFEVAGQVSEVGEGVGSVNVGDEVIAVTRFGGYSSHVVAPASQVFLRPKGWTAAEAAGFPTVFLTAYYALFELAHPRPGQTLLVHSAAGGVGGALLQLAKQIPCETVGVVGGSHKVETALERGATHVIDKSKEYLWDRVRALAPEGYSAVFDANGVDTLQQSYEHLATPGKLVIYGFHTMLPKQGGRPNWFRLAWGWLRTPRFNPLDLTGANRSVMGFNLSYLFHQQGLLKDAMQELLGWIDDGHIQPAATTCYPLTHVADAHRDLESGQTVGKLILTL